MQDRILQRLNSYIIEDHPDLVFRLNNSGGIGRWLTERVAQAGPLIEELKAAGKSEGFIEEAALNAITKGLRPSRFHYIAQLLEEDFAFQYYQMRESGVLSAFIIRIIGCCNVHFDQNGFCEEYESNPRIRKAIKAVLAQELPKY